MPCLMGLGLGLEVLFDRAGLLVTPAALISGEFL
jgi:hypothetical protein